MYQGFWAHDVMRDGATNSRALIVNEFNKQ
jgi:hypothetical protein